MLIRIQSDLHCEFWNAKNLEDQLNIVIPFMETDKKTIAMVAGDLGLFHRSEVWLKVLGLLSKQFKYVIFVAGNHEFYNNDWIYKFQIRKTKIILPKNVYFLEDQYVSFNNVLFIGATLWTDFDGDDFVMRTAERGMNDFRIIKYKDGTRFTPEKSIQLFNQSKEFIFKMLSKHKGMKTVVVTHHAPSLLSISPRFKGDILNHAFMSNLTEEILKYKPDLWNHGHMHSSSDYLIGDTRVINNPYGYKDQEVNPKYDPKLVIEI